jgi:FkbM family methyltransferase
MAVAPTSIPVAARVPAERIESKYGPLWMRADDHVMRPATKNSGVWEPTETQVLSTLVRPDCRFLDVGAHIGYFSVVANASAPNVVVDAIEPSPTTASLLRLNLFANNVNGTVWELAVGDKRDTLGFTEADHNPGDGRVVPGMWEANVVVPVLTADELFPDAVFHVIKIDVQGFEDEVLEGMQNIIRRSPELKVLVEFFPGALADRGRRPMDTLRSYEAMGFRIEALVGDKLLGLELNEILDICARAGDQGFVTLLLSR